MNEETEKIVVCPQLGWRRTKKMEKAENGNLRVIAGVIVVVVAIILVVVIGGAVADVVK